MRALILSLLLPLAAAPGDAVLPITDTTDLQAVKDDYLLVRKDVLKQLNADSKNLPAAEAKLGEAQEELKRAEATLKQAKIDLKKLQDAALDLKAANAELRAQKGVLEGHITKLEAYTCPEPTVGDQLAEAWEDVDGFAGVGAGFVLGTGTCVGIAYIFNQPAFVR